MLLFVLAGGSAWLWYSTPFFINPWATIEAMEQGSLPASTLSVMAIMLPMMVLTALILLLTLLLIPFAAFSNERRLIRIIRRLGDTE